jgi:hypothetical protein
MPAMAQLTLFKFASTRRSHFLVRAVGVIVLSSMTFIIGCAQDGPTTKPASMYDRQEQALHDPFGYTPDLKKSDMSVSGENDPNGLRRDLHDVFNP